MEHTAAPPHLRHLMRTVLLQVGVCPVRKEQPVGVFIRNTKTLKNAWCYCKKLTEICLAASASLVAVLRAAVPLPFGFFRTAVHRQFLLGCGW